MGTSSATAHARSVQEKTNTFVILVLVLMCCFFFFFLRSVLGAGLFPLSIGVPQIAL
jgi:predicted RND superfamily exporter protein